MKPAPLRRGAGFFSLRGGPLGVDWSWMARPGEAVACPACGARNKAKWEFCARCGESLQGAEASSAAAKKIAPVAERAQGVPTPTSSGNTILFGVSFALLVACAVGAVRYSRQLGPAPAPEAVGLTVPTQPAKSTPVPAPTQGPGSAAFQQGSRLLREGHPADAAGLLAQAVAEAPENALYQRTYGEALLGSGSPDPGLAAVAEAARIDPRLYRRDYAKSLGAAGHAAEAEAEFDAILVESPDDFEALAEAGRIAAARKDFAKGLPLLRRAAQQRPGDTYLLTALATATENSGDFKGAALAYGEVVLRTPADHNARGHLAEMLVKQGRIDQALSTLREGIQRAPGAAELRRTLGSVLEDAQRPAEAAAAYREYARLAPAASDAQELLARADSLAPKAATGS